MAEVGGSHCSEPWTGAGVRLWEAGQSPKGGVSPFRLRGPQR